jgi:hypothetical protein
MDKTFKLRPVSVMTIFILTVAGMNIQAQQQPDLANNLVRYLGFYVFNYAKCNPPKFEKIRWIGIVKFPDQDEDNPRTDRNGNTRVDGYVETVEDERYKFKNAFLKKNSEGNYEEFEFETEAVNGIHFTFKGSFLKKSVNSGGVYTDLRGNFLKYKNGESVAHLVMAPFSKYAEM